ncbi:MAG TPA: anthranilate synthase component 1 [Gemmatimonadales bacterium]|nr:anthranilate synthase component 1 [Gemmatimonadales bacterium]
MMRHQVPALTRRLDHAAPPLPLFRALTEEGTRPHTALLESAEPESRRHQRSLLMVSAALAITCRGEDVLVEALKPEAAVLLQVLVGELPQFHPVLTGPRLHLSVPLPGAHDTDADRLHATSALDVLRTIARVFRPERSDLPESVLLAGLFSYDLAEHFESLPRPQAAGLAVPHFRFYLADRVIIVDHLRGQTEIIAAVIGADEAAAFDAAREAVLEMSEAASNVEPDQPSSPDEPVAASTGSRQVDVDQDDAGFANLVKTLKRYITRGDVFQIVPSRTFSLPCPDPLGAYQRLRGLEPSPYLFFLHAGEFTLFGASPESAVKVDGRSRSIELSPIAGTRPRGIAASGIIDADLDTRYEAELRLDPKENAEHLMLVDLARNDVARISRPGTRRVTELLRVERFGRVMHLVSRVAGELAPGLDALHACQACFNLGTLTGAPKLRAMQLLREHEMDSRGHYGGAIGYLQGDGTLDTAIIIRAALVSDGTAHVRAGAGVVHDSIPEREADETRQKASVVLRAITESNAVSATEAAHA